MDKLRREIKENSLLPCYLFYGEEVYLKNRYEKLTIELFQNELSGDMNISVFSGEIEINKLMDTVETFPFFAEKRLVLVRDSKLFKAGKKNDSERLADYIANLPPTVCLLFIEEEIDKRSKLFKAFSKSGRCIEFVTPKEPQLIQWLKKEFKGFGIEIDNSTAAYFFRYVGENMENAYSELGKLASYKTLGETVTVKDIEEVCVKSLEVRVFELVGALGARDTKKAVLIYRNMLLSKESPLMILAMVTRQIRLMFQCKALEGTGQGTALIAQKLGQRDFAVRQALTQSKNFTLETLRRALQDCLDTDIAIKTGLMKDELAVELMIVKYSN